MPSSHPWSSPELKFNWRSAPFYLEAFSVRTQYEATTLQKNILKVTSLKIWKSLPLYNDGFKRQNTSLWWLSTGPLSPYSIARTSKNRVRETYQSQNYHAQNSSKQSKADSCWQWKSRCVLQLLLKFTVYFQTSFSRTKLTTQTLW